MPAPLDERASQPQPDDTEATVRHLLGELLAQHGFSGDCHEQGLHLPGGWRVEIAIADHQRRPTQTSIDLNLALVTPVRGDSTILTTLTGYGDDTNQAVADALIDWQHRIFAPVLAAITGARRPNGRMTITRTEAGAPVEREWALFEGHTPVLFAPIAGPRSASLHGVHREEPTLAELIGDQVLLSLVVEPLAAAVRELPERSLHWAKMFMAHFEDGRRISELHIDNVDWADCAKLETFRWPAHRGMLGLRYFACAIDLAVREQSVAREA